MNPIDLTPARLSGDPGPVPATCQWLTGDGPFTEGDKCGAPCLDGSAYCTWHRALAYLAEPEDGCRGSAERAAREGEAWTLGA